MRLSLTRLPVAILLATGLAACGGPEEAVEDFDDFDSAYQEGKEDAVRTARFEIFTGSDGKSYFHLLASNGQKLLQSQSYSSSSAAKDGIASVKTNVKNNDRLEFRESSDDQWYFVVKAASGSVLAWSEVYATESNAERALETVVSAAPAATIKTLKSASASFQVFRGLDGKYYFHVRAKHGEILVQSQAYTSRANAVNGSKSVTTNATTLARYQTRDSSNGEYYFVLRSTNGAVIAVSELYASRSNAERARDAFIALFKAGGVTAAK